MDEKLKTLLRLPRKSKSGPSPKERIAICNLMVGQYFKKERKRLGLSQALLAKKIGMPLTLSGLSRHGKQPRTNNAIIRENDYERYESRI